MLGQRERRGREREREEDRNFEEFYTGQISREIEEEPSFRRSRYNY